jgi:hypothetical protein
MRRIPRPSHATVVAYVALFVALTGGTTAVALSGSDTVQSDDLGPGAQVKAPDVADNAVNSADVLNGSLGLADLNATSRPHKLEFSATDVLGDTVATIGPLEVNAGCRPPSENGQTTLYVDVHNLGTQTATYNAVFSSQTSQDGPISWRGAGQFLGADDFVALRNNDAFPALARGAFNRVEGQVVFQTPGRVTTIDFHADTTNTLGCHFFGTAVTSSLS